MNRKHVTGIALLFALGSVAGMFALVRTIGIASSDTRAATDTLVRARTRQVATVHGLLAGTDTSRPWALGVYLAAVGAVTTATAFRVLSPKPRPQVKKAVAGAAAAADRVTAREVARMAAPGAQR